MSGRLRPTRELGSPLLANAAAHFSESLVSLELKIFNKKYFARNEDRHFGKVRRLGSVLRGTKYSTSAHTACSCGLHIYTCQNQHYPFLQLSFEGFTGYFVYGNNFVLHMGIIVPNSVPHNMRLFPLKTESL
jgi:hypothetical protein